MSLENINMDDNLDDFIAQVSNVQPKESELDLNSSKFNNVIQLRILKFLKEMNTNLVELKAEVSEQNKLFEQYERKIEDLKTENNKLQLKFDDLESKSRLNTLVLSGSSVKTENNPSPRHLLNQSITNIKETYDFDLQKEEVMNCHILRSKDNQNNRILLTLNNSFTKSDLINKFCHKKGQEQGSEAEYQ